MTDIEPNKIRTDGGTQARAGLNDETVTEYAEAMLQNGGWSPFPAVAVYYDGKEYWLADGFHRMAAWQTMAARPDYAKTRIPAIVRQGTQRDAILHSVGVNDNHGLRRSGDDKRRSVIRLLGDDEWGKWSNVEIARACKVSEKLVRNVRKDLIGLTSDGTRLAAEKHDLPIETLEKAQAQATSSERTYTTKHGTEATMNTAAIGNQVKQPSSPGVTRELWKAVERLRALGHDVRGKSVAGQHLGWTIDGGELLQPSKVLEFLERLKCMIPYRPGSGPAAHVPGIDHCPACWKPAITWHDDAGRCAECGNEVESDGSGGYRTAVLTFSQAGKGPEPAAPEPRREPALSPRRGDPDAWPEDIRVSKEAAENGEAPEHPQADLPAHDFQPGDVVAITPEGSPALATVGIVSRIDAGPAGNLVEVVFSFNRRQGWGIDRSGVYKPDRVSRFYTPGYILARRYAAAESTPPTAGEASA